MLNQKSKRSWFIDWLHERIKTGIIRHRKDGMSEYTITGIKNVRPFLLLIQPFLIIKIDQANLLLEIMNNLENLKTKYELLEVCKKVDKFGEFNDSKNRTINYNVVKEFFDKYFSP